MENTPKKNAIVITSIYGPTEAVLKFSKLKEYQVIIVADKKTPLNWQCNSVTFISIDSQKEIDFNLVKIMPFNHYSRKMLGYLVAINNNVDVIIDTDDDNIPKSNWSFPDFKNYYDCISPNMGFINVYQLYTKNKIWPRGLPLNLINKDFNLENNINNEYSNVGIWQGLADGDPDVDAIYRLTNDEPTYFLERNPVVLGKGTLSPFNSQNTIFRKELFPLLYLPTTVTFRFTDILRSLVAQPIMWLYGYQLGFISATVDQKRNPHDYMKDFTSEIPMYQYSEKVIELVDKSISVNNKIGTNLFNAYKALLDERIVKVYELETLEAWLKDLKMV